MQASLLIKLLAELAAEAELDPLVDGPTKRALTLSPPPVPVIRYPLSQGHDERLQGLRVFCEHRSTCHPDVDGLVDQPCPVERMSAVYALGRNPSPQAVEPLLKLQADANAYVRKATAWSLGNFRMHRS